MSCRDINELTQNAQIAIKSFLEECKNQGLNVCITETYRSQERQNELYEQGRTTTGKIVTWTKNSVHTKRMAWDICKNIKGHEYDDIQFFYKCGDIAKKLGITWGGTWEQKDLCHFQINDSWSITGRYAPKWQQDSLKHLSNAIGLDNTYWTNESLLEHITKGEVIALLDKLITFKK